MCVVGAVADLRPLLSLADRETPDAVLFDTVVGGMPGVVAAIEFSAVHPDVATVNLVETFQTDVLAEFMSEGLDRRAVLLLERLQRIDDLLGALRDVAQGGSVVDPRVVEILLGRSKDDEADPMLARLTPRETEVLAAMASGLSNSAIAARLYLSQRAVEKHINAIFSKLDLTHRPGHHRVQAVLRWLGVEGEAGASGC